VANKIRGEVEIKLGGRTWKMVPTFEALANIEQMTGKTTQTLLTDLSLSQLRAAEFVTMIYAGMRAADSECPGYDEIGKLIMEHGGVHQYREQLAEFFEGLVRFYSGDVADEIAKKKPEGSGSSQDQMESGNSQATRTTKKPT
jgi:hypothetical protein